MSTSSSLSSSSSSSLSSSSMSVVGAVATTATVSRFGLVGSFRGDNEKLKSIYAMRDRLSKGATTSNVTSDEVRTQLSTLPFSGRVEFMAKCFINVDMTTDVQQQNSRFIVQLFRECFDAIVSTSNGKTARGEHPVPQEKQDQKDQDQDEDDEFVIISLCNSSSTTTPSQTSAAVPVTNGPMTMETSSGPFYLRSSSYYVLHVLVAALQSFAPVVVQLFDEYTTRTTSTVFRTSFVKAMVSLPPAIFSDERLERVYLTSVEAMRRVIEAEAKLRNGERAAFLTRLINSGATSAATELIHYATPEALEKQFLRSVSVTHEPSTNGKTLTVVNAEWSWKLNWPLHAEVYLRFLGSHLETHKSDPIWCGRFLNEFTSFIQEKIPSPVAMSILTYYQTYRPLSIQSNVPQGVKEFLLTLSKNGTLTSKKPAAGSTASAVETSHESEIEYVGLERTIPSTLILRCVSANDRWITLKSMLVRTPDGFAFAPSSVELCKTLLASLTMNPAWHKLISELTVELLAALSAQEFFRLIFKNSTLDSTSSDPCVGGTLRVFLNASFTVPQFRFLKPVLAAWLKLHFDHPANEALTLKEFSGYTEMKLWNDWRLSVSDIFQRKLIVVATKAKSVLNSASVRTKRTPITSYVGYTGILGDDLFLIFERSAKYVQPIEFLNAVVPVLDQLSVLLDLTTVAPLYPPANVTKEVVSAPGIASLNSVRTVGERFIQLAMSVLRGALTFDLQSKQYGRITSQQLQPILTRLSSSTNLIRFPSSAAVLFDFYTSTLEAAKIPSAIARVGFIMVHPTAEDRTSGVKKISAVHINTNHHAQSQQMCMDALSNLCFAAKSILELHSIAQKSWPIVRSRYLPPVLTSAGTILPEEESLKSIGVWNGFIAGVANLPTFLAAQEKPLLLNALIHHLKLNTFTNASSGTGLEGWWSFLLTAIDACGLEWPSRNSWFLRFTDLSAAPVRLAFEQSTSDRDPQNRLNGYLQLLRVSTQTSWQEFATSVDYIQRRTKNEAGLYRRDIYQAIKGSLALTVSQSLKTAESETGPGEQATLASVTLLVDALIQIVKDDISKRDSVVKGAFYGLGRQLIEQAVSTIAPSLLAIRRAWIQCGMTLEWLLLRINGGEDACQQYVWPIETSSFALQQSITESSLAGPIQNALLDGFKGGFNTFTELRKKVYSTNQHVHTAPEKLYTPAQAVDLLSSSLLVLRTQFDDQVTVGGKSIPRPCDFLVDNALFPTASEEGNATAAAASETNPSLALMYKSGTLQNVQRLIQFCGVRWIDVPSLVKFFDTVIETVQTPPASRITQNRLSSHYHQTYTLFKSVRQLYASGRSGWYEIPSLARACTVLFEFAIRHSVVSDAQELRSVWSEMKMHRGKIATLGSLTLNELGFIIASVKPIQDRQALPANGPPFASTITYAPAPSPLAKTDRLLVDKADTTERSATILRDLLQLSPSALHMIWSELLAVRDDIFSTYLGRTKEELFGLFDPSATTNLRLPAKVGAEIVWFPITSAQLVSMNSEAMSNFTHMCMERATNQSLSASIRSAAITQFVESPTASHLDVIALLKKLQAIIAKKIEKEKEKKEKEKKEKEKQEKEAKEKNSAASGKESEEKKSQPVSSSSPPDTAVEAEDATDDAAELLLESVILRVFETDATWFILAYLLSPDVIASAPQRTTATILTRLALWAPVDRTVAILRILLEPRRRRAIGFFLHKQILRLLFECSENNQLARELFLTEWQQRNAAATKMPVDVLHEIVKLCIPPLNGSNEVMQTLAWRIIDDLVADAEVQDIDTATIISLFQPTWQPLTSLCPRLDEQAASLSHLIRTTQPQRVITAGVEAPDSFGFFHSQLQVEPPRPFRTSNGKMNQKMAVLMERLTRCKHPFVRVLSQFQQFLFSSSMEGLQEDDAVHRLHQLVVRATLEWVDNVKPTAASTPSTPSPWSNLVVELDHTTEWSLQIMSRLFAGLTLQVLTRALVTDSAEDQRPYAACALVCQNHPYAIRLHDTIRTLLTSLLQTPPSEVARRQRVAKVVMAIMSQVSATALSPMTLKSVKRTATTWAIELFQAPLKDLLNFLRQESQQFSSLPPGVSRT